MFYLSLILMGLFAVYQFCIRDWLLNLVNLKYPAKKVAIFICREDFTMMTTIGFIFVMYGFGVAELYSKSL